MTPERLKIAIDRYDRHMPLFFGAVQPPPGVEIEFLEVGMDPPRRHGVDRHRRMLVEREFDAAEVSLASYLVARDKGMDDLVALPVFPRRLFSHNHVFVGERSGIAAAADLVGRRVAIWAFQVTMSVLAKGDLKRDHDVDWRDIVWLTENREEISTEYGDDVRIERLPPGLDLAQALEQGEVDAYINPHPPEEIMTPGRGIRRLFPDWREASGAYVRKHGYFPVMHLLVVKRMLLERYPPLAAGLVDMFDTAAAMARAWYVDPGFSVLIHARNLIEYEEEAFGPSLWQSGLTPNRRNLEDFIGFCVDQRLIARAPALADLFHPSS